VFPFEDDTAVVVEGEPVEADIGIEPRMLGIVDEPAIGGQPSQDAGDERGRAGASSALASGR
jgi:hypothetical protein